MYRHIFVRFLVQMKTSKRHSEIIWPLVNWKINFWKIATKSQVVNTFNVTKSRLQLGLNMEPEIQILYDF